MGGHGFGGGSGLIGINNEYVNLFGRMMSANIPIATFLSPQWKVTTG